MAFVLPNSVFIHIPKTGGQWVVSALERSGLPVQPLGVVHTSPDEIAQEPAFAERSVVFAMVRHPLTWYQSMWSHRMDEEWTPVDDPEWFTPRWVEVWAEFTQCCRAEDFGEFVHRCTAHYSEGYVSMLYAAYTEGATFIGKQETLADDLCAALRLAGEEFQEEHLRRTPGRNIRSRTKRRQRDTRYTPELIDRVTRAEERALGRFGYESLPSLASGIGGGDPDGRA